jgi:amino acid permease
MAAEAIGLQDKRVTFGSKTIGFFAGVALLINNITGPGVPGLPNMFAEAGWFLPSLLIVLVWMASTLSASMYCEAMRKIPGNEHFKDRLEYSSIVKHYFGHSWYVASQLGLNGALQSLNIISVIQSAQVMDAAIARVFGATCGLNLTPFQGVWEDNNLHKHNLPHSADFFSCADLGDVGQGNPWGCHIVLSAGYLLVAMMAIPCGRWNLDDNMLIQMIAFFVTVAFWLIWLAGCFSEISSKTEFPSIPAINSSPDIGSQAGVLGSILFNFGYVTTVPSWVNEKHPSVSANKTLWSATTACVCVFFGVGIAGALAYSDVLQGPVTGTCAAQQLDASVNCANDLLQVLTQTQTEPAFWSDHAWSNSLLSLSVYLFPIASVVSSIPIFSIVIKYNLIENGFSNRAGFAWGVLFPWMLAFPLLYMPNALAQFLNYTSLTFVTFTDFIVPLALYIKLQRQRSERVDLSENNSVLGQELVDEGIHAHYAFPRTWALSPGVKISLAWILAAFLAMSALVAGVLTVQQGDYTFNMQVCALVGN